MESNVSLMIMYDDESVEVCYRNEDRLLLSPCGCEFVLVKACREPPLAEARVRQRTRFTTSTHKEMITGALTFRNTHASRPYLPAELFPADHKKPFFSIDSEAKWPELSSCAGELGCGGETIIRSEEGRAVLTLAPSGEEFSVRYTCSLSSHNQNHSTQPGAGGPGSSPGAAAGEDTDEEQLGRRKRKPEAAHQCTTVLQQSSRCCVAPRWRYPLSLARRLHTARLSEPEDVGAEESRRLSQAADGGRRSPLPQALPLTCPSPHLHRWRFDPLFKNEHQQLPGDLVKVMWCHGTTYRVLSGGVPVVEVSLGDGSIIRSDGVLSSYFTHHKPQFHSGKLKVKELTYHVNNLPPHLPGQPYSLQSVVNRASRILSSYSKAKLTWSPATASCLQVGEEPPPHGAAAGPQQRYPFQGQPPWTAAGRGAGVRPLSAEQRLSGLQSAAQRSGLVAAELEKIKEFRCSLNHEDECSSKLVRHPEAAGEAMEEKDIAEVLQRTSQAIRDIDAVVTAALQASQQS